MSRSYAANTAATKKPMEGMGSSANSVSISHSNIGEIKTIAKDESAERDSAGGYARTSPDADRRQVSVEEKFCEQNFRVLSEMRILAKIRMVIFDFAGYVEILAKFLVLGN